jgi:rare lipoprotein A
LFVLTAIEGKGRQTSGRPAFGEAMGPDGTWASLSAIARACTVGSCCLALASCGQVSSHLGPKHSPRVVQAGEPVPKGGGVYRVGQPYTIRGRTYSPEENNDYSAEGIASWYGEDFHGRLTANGEVYDMASISAAHPTLPIPSYARVTNLRNNRSIIVRVNDRGPYHQGRLIDVSVRAARLLGFHDQGTTRVRMEYVGPASLAGSDDTRLEATLRHGTPAPGPSQVKVATLRRAPQHAAAAPVAAPSQTETRTATRAAHSTFAGRFAPVEAAPLAATRPEPVSAYAAELPGRANGAVISGRGLY